LKEAVRTVVPGSVWARARRLTLKLRVRRYRRRIAAHRYGRSDLRVVIADPLAEGWYDHDWAELAELSLFEHGSLRAGAMIFDLGAHQGVVALMLERAVRPGGEVLAVELNEHNARIALENVQLNAPASVTVVRAAVTDREGDVRADFDLNASISPQPRGEVVPGVTVDGLSRTYGFPDLIYVDVEGHECHALRGASETLTKRPDWFIEVHAHGPLQEAGGSIEELLRSLRGYRLLVMLEGEPAFRDLPERLPAERLFLAALA
jgi:FkbM family methyltransferase